MRLRTAALLTFFFAGVLAFSSCTSGDSPYRIYPPADDTLAADGSPDCDKADLLSDNTFKSAAYIDKNPDKPNLRSKCYLSTYFVPGAEAWKDYPSDHTIAHPNTYTLSFVEMPETKKELLDPRQLNDLVARLKGKQQDVVMVYVHGWRHDADIGNGNVLKFRTMLGYTRSALNARCVETGKYCNSKLTGVYLSWRGRSFRESTEDNASFPGTIGAVPTVWGRKKQSEKLALGPVFGRTLEAIREPLTLRSGDASADKMLVIGHSFGGNMLATYLKPKIVTEILHGHTHGTQMKPPLGDLVVLLNPASEATNWTEIQRAMREKYEIPDKVNWVSNLHDADAPNAAKVRKWKKMFPRSQRPTYVSITATKDWNKAEMKNRPDAPSKYDKATGQLFPISRYVTFRFGNEKARAIGHLTPEYELYQHPRGGRFYRIAGPPVGTSHEFVVNSGKGADTRYEASGSPKLAYCGSHDGWLREAQARSGFAAYENWDSGSNKGKALLRNMKGGELQIRNALFASGKENRRAESVAQGTSPFWNMRALDTAVFNHAGFMNFVTLCGINLLWLDNATATTLAYDPKANASR